MNEPAQSPAALPELLRPPVEAMAPWKRALCLAGAVLAGVAGLVGWLVPVVTASGRLRAMGMGRPGSYGSGNDRIRQACRKVNAGPEEERESVLADPLDADAHMQ